MFSDFSIPFFFSLRIPDPVNQAHPAEIPGHGIGQDHLQRCHGNRQNHGRKRRIMIHGDVHHIFRFGIEKDAVSRQTSQPQGNQQGACRIKSPSSCIIRTSCFSDMPIA